MLQTLLLILLLAVILEYYGLIPRRPVIAVLAVACGIVGFAARLLLTTVADAIRPFHR